MDSVSRTRQSSLGTLLLWQAAAQNRKASGDGSERHPERGRKMNRRVQIGLDWNASQEMGGFTCWSHCAQVHRLSC